MSNLNEDEADAFFHQGDAGTYDGGPALSLVPVGMADPLGEDDRPRVLSPELIARRERLKRLVTTVVGTLGAGSVLLFALRITRSESETAGAASLGAVSVPYVAKPSAPPRAPEVLPTPAAPTLEVADTAAVVAPTVVVEQPVAQAPVAAPVTPEASPRTAAAVEPVHHTASVAVAATRTASSNRPSSERAAPRASVSALPSRVIPSQGSSGHGHTPPTATFPD